jgi:surface antigen Omp85-like protein
VLTRVARAASIAAIATLGTHAVFAQTEAPPVSVYGVVPQDSGSPHGGAEAEPVVPDAVDPTAASTRRGEIVIAPLPLINPTIGNGIIVLGGYLYRLNRADRQTPPSGTLLGGLATSNGSRGVMAAQSLHLGRDRVRVVAAGAYADVHYDFFGIGQDSGSAGISIPLMQKGGLFLVNGMVLLGARWYAGAQYSIMSMAVAIDPSESPAELPPILSRDVDLRTAALGPHLQRDTRDSAFYPRTGSLLNALAGFYGEAVGGQREYQAYQASFSQYIPLHGRQMVAWRASVCGVANDVPFYDLCQLGKSQDLRGYVVGQYRDRAMVAAQIEYRAEIWKRIGGTAFVGAGEVAPSLGALTGDALLPGGGVGVRLTVAKRNHVNIRADYAWGENSHAFYIGVAEAF